MTVAKRKLTPAMPVVQTPMDMIAHATTSGASVEVIAKLMDLQERWQANQARQAFDAAVSDAKNEMPTIKKNCIVSYGHGKTAYQHEDMAEIAKTVDPILTSHGLSYRFRANQEGPVLSVTCVLAHRDGHYEETTLSAPNDTSGSKNPIQAVGSSATYLQRYTLKLALGLAAAKDDDARTVSETATAKITPEQLQELKDLAKELNVDVKRFCLVRDVANLDDILIKDFQDAKNLMNTKRRK